MLRFMGSQRVRHDCVGKEGPHLTMMGSSREFSRAAVPVRGFHEVGRGAQGASRVAPGKLGSPSVESCGCGLGPSPVRLG